MNESIIKEINNLKESLNYDYRFIEETQNKILKDSNTMDHEGFNSNGLFIKTFIDNDKEMILKRKESIKYDYEKLQQLENKVSIMLKHFDPNMSNKTKGMCLKLLNKSYNNPFKDLKGYSLKLYELVNYSIDNNIKFYLQYRTLENNCLKVYDSELKRWL